MTRSRVLVADDHKLVAEGVVRLLGDHYEVVGTISDGSNVVDAVSRLRPDVLVLDVSMPNVSGFEVLGQLRATGAHTAVIVLTMYADASLAVEALKAGARGFVLKESSGDELLGAVATVLNGRTYLAAALTKEILTQMVGAPDPDHVALTQRQREVLRLVLQGHRAKEIADTLAMSTRTVEAIKYKMMRSLRVHSTAELVRYAMERRLVAF